MNRCPHCHRPMVTRRDRDLGTHAGCLGAAATQALLERTHAAMAFAGEPWAAWRLVADLYEPEPWRPLSVQYDVHYGRITFTQRTDVVEMAWDFFGDTLTRVESGAVFHVSWTFVDQCDGQSGLVHVSRREPCPLGTAVADLLRAASEYAKPRLDGT